MMERTFFGYLKKIHQEKKKLASATEAGVLRT
jgi:hypothetical protein